jgi:hypothetical protein
LLPLGIENIARAKKQTLIFSILKYKATNDEDVQAGDEVAIVSGKSGDILATANSLIVSLPCGGTNFDMSNPILNLKDKIIPIATLLMALFFL